MRHCRKSARAEDRNEVGICTSVIDTDLKIGGICDQSPGLVDNDLNGGLVTIGRVAVRSCEHDRSEDRREIEKGPRVNGDPGDMLENKCEVRKTFHAVWGDP